MKQFHLAIYYSEDLSIQVIAVNNPFIVYFQAEQRVTQLFFVFMFCESIPIVTIQTFVAHNPINAIFSLINSIDIDGGKLLAPQKEMVRVLAKRNE
ncbi:MAG: hypothetical protein ACJAWV_001109 [Flammeovirgaceae bacterium]|jgi:hypothetical protein